MNLYLEHGDEKQAYEIAKQRDLVLFEPEAALYLAERYLEEGRDDEASALTRESGPVARARPKNPRFLE